jgi:hypothetical protein
MSEKHVQFCSVNSQETRIIPAWLLRILLAREQMPQTSKESKESKGSINPTTEVPRGN